MSSIQALPYITLTNMQVAAGDWYPVDHENLSTQQEPAYTGITDWSYDDLLRIGRDIRIDADQCLEAIRVHGNQTQLKLTVLLEAGQPGLRHCLYSKVLSKGDVLDEFLVVECPGADVSENIKVNTVITLDTPVKSAVPYVPKLPGSRLWEDRHNIPLEGMGSRFPMRSCSFKTLVRVPDQANWFLEWSPDLADHAFAGTVLLYINTDNKEFSEQVINGDPAVLTALKSDVAIEICTGMLANKEFRENQENYEPGSIGAICNSWLEMAFPGRTRGDLYRALQERTSEFFTSLRAAFM